MKRYEAILAVKVLEETKGNLELLRDDLYNMYADGVQGKFQVETSAYNKLYKGDYIELKKDRFYKFIVKEIEMVEDNINEIVMKYIYKKDDGG